VVLQTVQGTLKGAQNAAQIHVMFDTGSHKSFVTSKVVRATGLPVKRKEWSEISMFGKAMNDYKLRDVFDLEIAPCKGEKRLLSKRIVLKLLPKFEMSILSCERGNILTYGDFGSWMCVRAVKYLI
jgi:hypothetical protein